MMLNKIKNIQYIYNPNAIDNSFPACTVMAESEVVGIKVKPRSLSF